MNESQINLDLYHKMREEQDEYRSWLLSQTPKEILAHASEYSTREDILATMCEGHYNDYLQIQKGIAGRVKTRGGEER